MTAPTNALVSLNDFLEVVFGLEADAEGFYAISNRDAYLLNIILRLAIEHNLATDNSQDDQEALDAINADLAVLNGELTDAERGHALSQLGLWAQTENWVDNVADKLSNTIYACRIDA